MKESSRKKFPLLINMIPYKGKKTKKKTENGLINKLF